MHGIDRAPFELSPTAGIAVAFMVGFLVFAVALQLRAEQFRRVLRAPKAPVVGLVGQFVVLPAVAYAVGVLSGAPPSVALGLLLVASCPGGALSNYFSAVAKADVATSISMTATSTVLGVGLTPVVFGFWASLHPATASLLAEIGIDVGRVVASLLIMLVIPVGAGMGLAARRPALAERIHRPTRRAAMVVFAVVVTAVLGTNLRLLIGHAAVAIAPVLATFALAMGLGWTLARLAGVNRPQRRAVTLEVGMQNVGLAIGTAVACFPEQVGAAVTCTLWGVVHLVLGFALAAVWGRVP